LYKARITKEYAKEILNAINNDKFLIKVKFIWKDKDNFKIVDKYKLIYELKKANKKFVLKGLNIILIKKMKPDFWIGNNKKFLVKVALIQSDIEFFTVNIVVYELYRI